MAPTNAITDREPNQATKRNLAGHTWPQIKGISRSYTECVSAAHSGFNSLISPQPRVSNSSATATATADRL
jgi:hypothetical protein